MGFAKTNSRAAAPPGRPTSRAAKEAQTRRISYACYMLIGARRDNRSRSGSTSRCCSFVTDLLLLWSPPESRACRCEAKYCVRAQGTAATASRHSSRAAWGGGRASGHGRRPRALHAATRSVAFSQGRHFSGLQPSPYPMEDCRHDIFTTRS
jgi:hypothetical protein